MPATLERLRKELILAECSLVISSVLAEELGDKELKDELQIYSEQLHKLVHNTYKKEKDSYEQRTNE